MIGTGADNSDTDSFFEIESSVSVDDVKPLSGVEIISGKVFEDCERTGSHGHVDFSPRDFLLTNGVLDDSFGTGISAKNEKKDTLS